MSAQLARAEPPRLAVTFDPVTDCLTIEGVRYPAGMFRALSRVERGAVLQIRQVEDGGFAMVSLRRPKKRKP